MFKNNVAVNNLILRLRGRRAYYPAGAVLFMLLLLLISGSWAIAAGSTKDPNKFNRLFVPPKDRTQTLAEDGVHDPAVTSLKTLQQPKTAFKPLPQSPAGNFVDWSKAIVTKKITPRNSHQDVEDKSLPMNLDIVMQVKGSMPDVSFPHKAHTQWLECNNCHTDIFIPQKGANRMSMLEIMLGQKCGVCHGSVAFPVTECRRCHSVAKAGNKTSKKAKAKKAAAKK